MFYRSHVRSVFRPCSDAVCPLVEGVLVLPAAHASGGGCHVVAVVSTFQGASGRLLLGHRDALRRISQGNGLSSTLRLF